LEAISNSMMTAVAFAYLASSVLYLCFWVMKRKFFGTLATVLTWISLAVLTAAIILRWIAMRQLGYGLAPLSNLFESLIFFGWSLALAYLILEWKTGLKILGALAMPLAFFAMLYALSMDPSIKPLLPALKSNWLIAHVITCFLGYAAFGISCAVGLVYILTSQGKEPATPRAMLLDEIIYQTVVLGFILLTAGIVTGSIWANSAWGTYWSWDPKETWSLVTWLVYAGMLHSRFLRGWRGFRLALFSVIGFACVLFTYFGVNFLLSGLHSYAKG
jgi:cytochrome c-type biogenesis protein CcsB